MDLTIQLYPTFGLSLAMDKSLILDMTLLRPFKWVLLSVLAGQLLWCWILLLDIHFMYENHLLEDDGNFANAVVEVKNIIQRALILLPLIVGNLFWIFRKQ